MRSFEAAEVDNIPPKYYFSLLSTGSPTWKIMEVLPDGWNAALTRCQLFSTTVR